MGPGKKEGMRVGEGGGEDLAIWGIRRRGSNHLFADVAGCTSLLLALIPAPLGRGIIVPPLTLAVQTPLVPAAREVVSLFRGCFSQPGNGYGHVSIRHVYNSLAVLY